MNEESLAAAFHAHALANPTAVTAALAVTALGSVWAIGLVALGAAVHMIRRRQFGRLTVWLVALTGGGVLREVLKRTFQRPRPVFPDPVVVEQGMSFPSGHVLGSVICFGVLTYFVLKSASTRRARLLALVGYTTLVAAIGFSRLYLGVHYLSDVLAGGAMGGGWVAVCAGVSEAVCRVTWADTHRGSTS